VRRSLVRQPSHTNAAVQPVDESEKDKRNPEQGEGELIGGRVFDGLDVIVNGDGDGARCTGEIAADHEHDAEFTEGVREGKDNRSDYTRERERKNDGAEDAEFVGAEDSRGVEEFWIEAFE
jgi:hypothetical protein